MKGNSTSGSGLIKTAYYIWNDYCRRVDRFESVFMHSSVMKLSRSSAGFLSVCVEGSILTRISRPSNGCVYSGSALLVNIRRSFCRAESLIGSYYEGSGFKRLAAEIYAMLVPVDMLLSGTDWDTIEDNSRIIGVVRRCSRKK